MNFPYEPSPTLHHKWGGTIQKVYGIGHREERPKGGRSCDYWFFDCDVLWHDTGKVSRHEVEPFKLAADKPNEHEGLKALRAAMNDYLLEHGEWCKSGSKHEGWYAHRKDK